METTNLDNSFKKIFSNSEKRNDVIVGRERERKSTFSAKMDNDQVERKMETISVRNEICGK